MTEIFKAIILGIVEGVTEFLPISSTGHLILVNQWLAFDEQFTQTFDIVIQLGAILAVIVYFWDRLWPFRKTSVERQSVFDIWRKVLLGVVPALILGFIFSDIIEERLFQPMVVALMLILGGGILLLVERKNLPVRFSVLSGLGYTEALIIGLAQSVAMIPGVSRSAATIIGGMMLGLSRSAAAEFSFLLAVPTMIAASSYTLFKTRVLFGEKELLLLAVGFITAFLVAWSVTKVFLSYVQKNNFRIFAYYRIILGLLVVFYFVIR